MKITVPAHSPCPFGMFAMCLSLSSCPSHLLKLEEANNEDFTVSMDDSANYWLKLDLLTLG